MDKKELHRRIIKSFIEPSLFYIPDRKTNDGLRIYTKYYNVYTKKVEEFDLVSKTIHTPVIRDEYGDITHPNFKMDGYYVIYDELKNIVATSWHYEKKNDYVYMVNNGLYNTLDKVYPKGTYIIHEEVPPTYGFKQMNDFTLTLSTGGRLIDINKSIYRETLGYIFCGDPQIPNWHLPYLIDSLPIDTGIECENPEMYARFSASGGEIPFLTYLVRELNNGNPFKNISSCDLQGYSYNCMLESTLSTYRIVPSNGDDNRYLFMAFNDGDGNLSDGFIIFQTHRNAIRNIDNEQISNLGGLWYFNAHIGFDFKNGDDLAKVPTVGELEKAVDNYMESKSEHSLQILDGHDIYWIYPSEDKLDDYTVNSDKSLFSLVYDNSAQAFLNDEGYHCKSSQSITISSDVDYIVETSVCKVEMLSENIPQHWNIDDTANSIFGYDLKKAYRYDTGEIRHIYYIGMYTYYGYKCDTKSLLDNSMIDKELKENPILIT